MNGKCFDIGAIQAFLDGETAPELTARITDHIAACDTCAVRLAEADEENSIVFSALDREFNNLVPTQRLWARINDTIAVEKSQLSVWQRLFGAFSFYVSSPTFAAVAGVVMLAGVFGVVNGLRQSGVQSPGGEIAQSPAQPAVVPQRGANTVAPTVVSDKAPTEGATASARPTVTQAAVKESRIPAEKIRNVIVNANYEAKRNEGRVQPIEAAYLPGEDSYVKTIAELKQAVDGQKDRILTPSSRIAYERDMAVVNDSIKRMQSIVRSNPRNHAAKQVLLSAYQDKIDLLNSVAQREELMATLR